MSFFLENVLNSSFVDVLKIYCTSINTYILNSVVFFTKGQTKSVLTVVESFPESFHCDEFQWKLLKGFSFALFINLLLIFITWRIFGKRICERFMQPGMVVLLFIFYV